MYKTINMLAGAFALCALASGPLQAASVTTGYDIRLLMGKSHPFAGPGAARATAVASQPGRPQAQPARLRPAPVATLARRAAPPSPDRPAAATAGVKTRALWPGGSEKSARASSHGNSLGGILAEVSIGALRHDKGPISSSKEDGYDGHIELRFASPDFLAMIGAPEPHIGANINSAGDTSQVFFGLSYEWRLWKGLFAGFSLGGAYHNGETDAHLPGAKDLGCHLLFRESLTLGWAITENHKVAGIFDHISNASICDYNEGLDNMGIRYSYRF